MSRDLLGLPVPQLVQDRAFHDLFEGWHYILSYLLAALIVVHIAGALRHHLLKRNDVLLRMWFGRASPEARIDGAAPKKGVT